MEGGWKKAYLCSSHDNRWSPRPPTVISDAKKGHKFPYQAAALGRGSEKLAWPGFKDWLGEKMCQRLSFSLLDVINSTLELGSNEAEIKFKTALGKKRVVLVKRIKRLDKDLHGMQKSWIALYLLVSCVFLPLDGSFNSAVDYSEMICPQLTVAPSISRKAKQWLLSSKDYYGGKRVEEEVAWQQICKPFMQLYFHECHTNVWSMGL